MLALDEVTAHALGQLAWMVAIIGLACLTFALGKVLVHLSTRQKD